MTKNCFDIGEIQAFLDGELGFEKSESAARHISACGDCARLLAEAEEESAIAFSALEQEFNTLVPTQRLWAKINDSIGREKKSFWKSAFAFALQPSTAAFASLLFVAALFVALWSLKPDSTTNYVARETKVGQNAPQAMSRVQPTPLSPVSTNLPDTKSSADVKFNQSRNEYRAIRADFVRDEIKPPNAKVQTHKTTNDGRRTTDKPLAGEESYLKTIATLTSTVNNRKNEILKPSARFAFERDMAVTDDAIEKMRAAVKQNPRNESAKQILRASYQNKIDLLNSVAEKNELMASLK